MSATPVDTTATRPVDLITAALSGRMSERVRKGVTAYLVAATLVSYGRKAHRWVRSQIEFTVTIADTDDIYPDVQEWLLSLIPEEKRRSLAARSTREIRNGGTAYLSVPSDDTSEIPEPERLRLAYDGTKMQTVTIDGHRIRVSVLTETREAKEFPLLKAEQVTFTAGSYQARQAVIMFLGDIAAARHHKDRTPNFYLCARWGDWYRRNDLPKRTTATVVLPAGQMDRLIADVEQFRDAEADYNRLGVPYHRGYLFHGPPGTGKTSIAKALASHFGMDVYYLPLSDLNQDTALLNLVSQCSAGSMLLIEDIDVLQVAHDRADDDSGGDQKERVSLSGLLNALDGIGSPHGLITVLTTNHVEKLDPALIRPGRVDVSERVGFLTDDQLVGLYRLVYNEEPTFPALRPEQEITAAEVVDILKRNLDSDVAAHTEITAMLATSDARR